MQIMHFTCRQSTHHCHTPKLGKYTPSMADGTGDLKNGNAGPTGPKCNLLKHTPPTNAREYYNSKVPRVGNQKTKILNCSTSVELRDCSQSAIDHSLTYTYANSI